MESSSCRGTVFSAHYIILVRSGPVETQLTSSMNSKRCCHITTAIQSRLGQSATYRNRYSPFFRRVTRSHDCGQRPTSCSSQLYASVGHCSVRYKKDKRVIHSYNANKSKSETKIRNKLIDRK